MATKGQSFRNERRDMESMIRAEKTHGKVSKISIDRVPPLCPAVPIKSTRSFHSS